MRTTFGFHSIPWLGLLRSSGGGGGGGEVLLTPNASSWTWATALVELVNDVLTSGPSAWSWSLVPSEMVDVPVTPTMTSNTTPAGYSITDYSGSPDAYKPLNDVNWVMGTLVNSSNIWWTLQLSHPRILARFDILISVAGGLAQIIVSLEGSNDGSSWTLLDNPAAFQLPFQNFSLDLNGTAYKYHRLNFGQTYTQTTTVTLHSITPTWTTLFEGI